MLLTAGLIAAGWIAVLIVVVALCSASGRADAASERAYRGRGQLEI